MAALANYFAILVLVIFLVVLPISADDDICSQAQCGKGTCKATTDAYKFKCECDAGWKPLFFNNLDMQKFEFLPCVVPNCTLDFSCTGASAPPPPPPANTESFMNTTSADLCDLVFCGGGSCSPSGMGYSCQCKKGFTNFMNIPQFPCYNECILGDDCKSLGVSVSNDKSASSGKTPSALYSTNHASASLPGSFIWLTILTISFAMLHKFD